MKIGKNISHIISHNFTEIYLDKINHLCSLHVFHWFKLFLLFLLISCSNKSNNILPDCDINSGPCIKYYKGKEISLDIEPKPIKAMKPLYFRVKLKNYNEVQSMIIDLSMPEMTMGFNHVKMKNTGSDIFEGPGIIPVCPTGKKLWKVRVIIDGQKKAEFLFNVQY